ncbi:PREDICTED: uncharacterized protein LOC104767359 [Camelina sativa]|uniref:Uncharacterized protein LOC104767359 n=1 Tax=Camelina sativa TaxID=90675 RepID=A0ABM0XR81_CAMSA|nr:PREDICTED: uncharacterized protein LOC104767359 [Camelina sativa]
MARESPDGDLVDYEAKTEKRVWQRKPHVIFCRQAPKPKDPTDDDFVYTDTSSDDVDSDASSRDSGQEWDVDSLDDQPEYKLPKVNIPSDDEVEKMRLYRPQMRKSKGFYVDGECYSGRMRYFSPVDLNENVTPNGITGREYMQNMVDLALERYNEIKGSSVTCEFVVRANLTKVGGYKSYITFMAREVPGEDLVEYQAKTEKKFSQRKAHAIFCRPSPKSNGVLLMG